MSTNCSPRYDLLEHSSSSSSSSSLSNIRVPMLGAGTGGSGYAAWKPLMENYMMRNGVADGDYKTSNPDWLQLVKATEQWRELERKEAVAFVLNADVSSSSQVKAVVVKAEKMEEGERKNRAIVRGMVENASKAFTILYMSLTDELRLLVQEVPKGYAFGIWDFLLKKYQNTEQDNVGDLWHQYVSMEQMEEEQFVEYKARVDATWKLLVHAKATMQDLYSYLVLSRLRPQYSGAVLALRAADKVKDSAAIKWDEVVTFVNNYERGSSRLNSIEVGLNHEKLMAARGNRYSGKSQGGKKMSSSSSSADLSRVQCFGCKKFGHYKSECSERNADDDDSEDEVLTGRRRHRERIEEARAAGEGDDVWTRTY